MSGFRRPHLKPTRRSPPPQRASQRHRGRHTPASVRNSPHGIFHVEHPTPRLHHPGLAWASSVELGVRRSRRASAAHLRSPHPRPPRDPPDTLQGRHDAIVAATPSRRTHPARKFHVEHPTRGPPFTPGVYLGFKRPHRASHAPAGLQDPTTRTHTSSLALPRGVAMPSWPYAPPSRRTVPWKFHVEQGGRRCR